MNGHLNVVKELLSRGAVIYTENKDYFTPFELANNEGKLEVVNFLLNRQDNYGKRYCIMLLIIETKN
ncbi:hypothetical protein [Wolbachia endosymbiont of Armadillidium arcangelii]|uniref:Ankyrin repeat protein n=2 Tax=unclassified Wolbachia TaxID=2640676 RepID=A0AAU7Q3U6_9RICK